MGKWHNISSDNLTKVKAQKGIKTRKEIDKRMGRKHHYRVYKTKRGYGVQGYE